MESVLFLTSKEFHHVPDLFRFEDRSHGRHRGDQDVAGDLIWTKIAFFSGRKGDSPEQIRFLGENARDLFSFSCFQNDGPEAVGNFTAGG